MIMVDQILDFRHLIFLSSLLLSFTSVHSLIDNNSRALDSLIRNYAMEELVKQPTGILFNVTLPSNITGIQVSVVRLRSGTFWERGANFSDFYIPPRIIPFPFVKRLAIVYQNLGKLSSNYYSIPGYTLVAPVIGFRAYDASNLKALGNDTLKFSVLGNPIAVRFSNIKSQGGFNVHDAKCVKFLDVGLVQLRNTTDGNVCITQCDGHFSIAIPSTKKRKVKIWEWWVIGIGAALVGSVLLCIIVFTTCKLLRSKRIKQMESESQKGVAIDDTWIGRSRMPAASMTRTLPSLEHDYAP